MEYVFYFAKIEPFLPKLREMFNSPRMYAHLEQLVMQIPDAKQRLAMMRERSKRMAEMRRAREAGEAAKAAS